MTSAAMGIGALVSLLGPASAQKLAPLSFEVASVKIAAPGADGMIRRMMHGGPGTTDPGTLSYSNVTLKLMAMLAYGLKDYQVEGPDWIDVNGYDVTAKMPPGTTTEQFCQMLQTLLAERFQLTVHRETKQLPIYALTVAKGGPKMKEVEMPALVDAAPPPPPPPGGRMGAMPNGPGVRLMISPTGPRLSGYMTMAQLAGALGNTLSRPVVDQTELTATYEVDVTWTPDELDRNQGRMGQIGAMMGPPPGGAPAGEAPRGPSEPGLSLPQALQENLGLKLDPRKSSAEVLIVDHAEKVPVQN